MKLTHALRVIEQLRRIDPDMPIAQAHCLIAIAMSEDGLSLVDLAKKVGIGAASTSRYVAALGKVDRHRETGLGLVQAHEDPLERRKKIVSLTKKGKTFIEELTGEHHADLS